MPGPACPPTLRPRLFSGLPRSLPERKTSPSPPTSPRRRCPPTSWTTQVGAEGASPGRAPGPVPQPNSPAEAEQTAEELQEEIHKVRPGPGDLPGWDSGQLRPACAPTPGFTQHFHLLTFLTRARAALSSRKGPICSPGAAWALTSDPGGRVLSPARSLWPCPTWVLCEESRDPVPGWDSGCPDPETQPSGAPWCESLGGRRGRGSP